MKKMAMPTLVMALLISSNIEANELYSNKLALSANI
jgi:hypothetical protein